MQLYHARTLSDQICYNRSQLGKPVAPLAMQGWSTCSNLFHDQSSTNSNGRGFRELADARLAVSQSYVAMNFERSFSRSSLILRVLTVTSSMIYCNIYFVVIIRISPAEAALGTNTYTCPGSSRELGAKPVPSFRCKTPGPKPERFLRYSCAC